jgi:hypothetical protein
MQDIISRTIHGEKPARDNSVVDENLHSPVKKTMVTLTLGAMRASVIEPWVRLFQFWHIMKNLVRDRYLSIG